MKKCPNCSSVYNDNIMIKCTNCGADLIEITAEQPYNTVPPTNNNTYYSYNAQGTPQYKYCTHCGNKCDPLAVICVRCGMPFTNIQGKIPAADDKPSGGLKFLCFFIPILGLILYLVNMNDKPVSAKAYGKTALAGFIVGIILYILLIVAVFIIFPIIFGFNFVADSYYAYNDSEIYYYIINSLASLIK